MEFGLLDNNRKMRRAVEDHKFFNENVKDYTTNSEYNVRLTQVDAAVAETVVFDGNDNGVADKGYDLRWWRLTNLNEMFSGGLDINAFQKVHGTDGKKPIVALLIINQSNLLILIWRERNINKDVDSEIWNLSMECSRGNDSSGSGVGPRVTATQYAINTTLKNIAKQESVGLIVATTRQMAKWSMDPELALRECPFDLKEAISMFVDAATKLLPECGVDRRIKWICPTSPAQLLIVFGGFLQMHVCFQCCFLRESIFII
ncbi:hypothetical protein M8C21_002972 [Ambrosia artemisiifolia]|uniref:Uncharacterized protein n=1 Tax=Ambrosia artemisiifolia TaxID=4212 RepID=A0AAD5CS43_AMBAR|nr:hypothetical protein M8C21_002972 [Ambrosia artemisiifolia]